MQATPEPLTLANPAPSTANDIKEDPSTDRELNASAPPIRSEDRPSVPKNVSVPRAIVSTILLSMGTTRGEDTSGPTTIPKNATQIDLTMTFEAGEHRSYFAVVETADGQQIWRGRLRRRKSTEEVKTATISLPAKRLPKGDYIISLKGLLGNGTYEPIADYSVSIGN